MALRSIPEHYVTEFETNWEHKAGQKMSLLKDCVVIDHVAGKEKVYNKIGSVEFQMTNGRAEETRENNVETEKRWLRPYPYDSGAQIFDQWDEDLLGKIASPTHALVEEHARGYGKLLDGVIVQAGIGEAYTGEQGTSAVSLPGDQIIAVDYVETGVAANSGLTIGKLRQAKYILDNNDVDDDEERTIAYSAKELQQLLRSTEIGSSDFNNVKALVDGEVETFLGFKFKRVSRRVLPLVNSVRTCVFWAKTGIRLSDSGRQTFMDILPTRSHALQVRSTALVGATRDEEAKVGIIYCDTTK